MLLALRSLTEAQPVGMRAAQTFAGAAQSAAVSIKISAASNRALAGAGGAASAAASAKAFAATAAGPAQQTAAARPPVSARGAAAPATASSSAAGLLRIAARVNGAAPSGPAIVLASARGAVRIAAFDLLPGARLNAAGTVPSPSPQPIALSGAQSRRRAGGRAPGISITGQQCRRRLIA